MEKKTERPGNADEPGGIGVRRVIGVASGNGGVGTSSVAVLPAQALDADITGPSIPRLLGLDSFRGEIDGKKLVPLVADGMAAKTELALSMAGPAASRAGES